MLPWLVANNGVPLSDFAEKFGVSEKQAIADLALLTMTGPGQYGGELVDIIYDNDYVSVMDAQGLEAMTKLEENEAKLLAQTLLSIGGTLQESFLVPVTALINKLLNLDSPLISHFPIKDIDDKRIETISRSIAKRQNVTFDYRGERDSHSRSRMLSPYRFEFRSANNYLVGLCHETQSVKTFILDRIENLQVTDSGYVFEDSVLQNNSGDSFITVNAIVHNSLLSMMENYPGYSVVQNRGNDSEVVFHVFQIEHLVRLGLKYRHKIIIITPSQIEDSISEIINKFFKS
jgi:predicted DNA-binding transcriptional regulator YafY